jgi:alpha-tubulin suppressor-like RCC1 family protein
VRGLPDEQGITSDGYRPFQLDAVDIGEPALGLAMGYDHVCVLLMGGRVRCWGPGKYGVLGYGRTESIGDDETPASAGDVDVGGHVVKIAAGGTQTCVVLDTGNVRCWGGDDHYAGAGDHFPGSEGQLGYGNIKVVGDDETPASLGDVDVGDKVVSVATGYLHTCALLVTGSVRCWGEAGGGPLGYARYDSIGDDETPAKAGDVPIGSPVEQVAAGGSHTCVLLEGGVMRCWGNGMHGETGYGAKGTPPTPGEGDVDVGGPVLQMALGSNYTCALLVDGRVRCWGEAGPRLGYPAGAGVAPQMIGDDETPAEFGKDVELGGKAVQIAAGIDHTCAVLEDGTARCWGSGFGSGYGNALDKPIGDDETPADMGPVPIMYMSPQ